MNSIKVTDKNMPNAIAYSGYWVIGLWLGVPKEADKNVAVLCMKHTCNTGNLIESIILPIGQTKLVA